jgi:predicted O-methyltransferase YrrM
MIRANRRARARSSCPLVPAGGCHLTLNVAAFRTSWYYNHQKGGISMSTQAEVWKAVDQYYRQLCIPQDAILEAAQQTSAGAGLPAAAVSPLQGQLLYLLARIQGARSILEIGSLGGYSAIWLARALPPEGQLVSLELNPDHAAIARTNLERAGLAHLVDIRLGAALNSLSRLAAEGRGPFDMIFIDADKTNYAGYLEWAVKLSRPGSLIVADNVVRNGAVIDAGSTDPNVQGVRRFNEMLAAQPRLSATAVQTVGEKGYDGFILAVVLPD